MSNWRITLIAIYLLYCHGVFGLRGGLIRSGRASSPVFLRDGPLIGRRQFEHGNFYPLFFGKRSTPSRIPTDGDSQTCSCSFPNGKTIIIVDQTGQAMMEPTRFG